MDIQKIVVAGAIALFSASAWAANTGMDKASTTMMGNQRCTHYATTNHETGVHQMVGAVTAINHRTGIVSVKTTMGLLRLHFPPASLRQVKRGERIDVHLGFTPLH
ncbi:MAG: hypothetical protein ACYDDA_13745 [Acidiferrobacteraceae bacterium]